MVLLQFLKLKAMQMMIRFGVVRDLLLWTLEGRGPRLVDIGIPWPSIATAADDVRCWPCSVCSLVKLAAFPGGLRWASDV